MKIYFGLCRRQRALCRYNLGEISEKEKRVKLNEALQLTIPHWDGKNVPKGVFTRTECGIICNIAVSYMQEENYQEALDIMRQMQKYFETTRMNEEEKCVSEGLLLSNLAQCPLPHDCLPVYFIFQIQMFFKIFQLH